MRIALCSLLGLLAFGSLGPAQAQDPLEQGNEAFWKGDHDAAAKAYRAAVAARPTNADLWYNLGTAEASSGRYGHAIHAFEQALILRPHDEDAEYNLKQTRSQVLQVGLAGSGKARVVPPGEDDLGTGLLTAMSAQAVGLVFVITWAALFGLLLVWRSTRKPAWRTASSFIALIMGLLAAASGGVLLARIFVLEAAVEGVVLEPSAVYTGPGRTYGKGPTLLGGVKLRLRGTEEAWRQITLPDGSEAWIEEARIGVLRRH